jgi:hypothetical protein
MTTAMISAKHPVRAAVADINTYQDSKGSALHAVQEACADHGIEIVHDDCSNLSGLSGASGRVEYRIRPFDGACVVCDKCDKCADDAYYGNVIVFAWYTMPASGRIELTAYVS